MRDELKKKCENCGKFKSFHESSIPLEISVDNYEVRCRYCKRYLGTYTELVEALESDK